MKIGQDMKMSDQLKATHEISRVLVHAGVQTKDTHGDA
jgi:hypothetical protein